MELVFHHTGIVVDSIEEASQSYIALLGPDCIAGKYFISSQQVNVCFIQVGAGIFLELVEPTSEDSTVARLKKKGHSFYHIAFLTGNIDKAVEYLESNNYKALEFFHSEAFGGKRCIFLFSPDAHLIELIEH